jgi:hypothetical protein
MGAFSHARERARSEVAGAGRIACLNTVEVRVRQRAARRSTHASDQSASWSA